MKRRYVIKPYASGRWPFRRRIFIVWDTIANRWVDTAWCGRNESIVQMGADQLNEFENMVEERHHSEYDWPAETDEDADADDALD